MPIRINYELKPHEVVCFLNTYISHCKSPRRASFEVYIKEKIEVFGRFYYLDKLKTIHMPKSNKLYESWYGEGITNIEV